MGNMIVDLVVIAIFLILIFLGWQRGFVSSLIGFFGNIAALLLAWFLKGNVAALIDSKFMLTAKWGDSLSNIIPMPEELANKMASFDALGSFYTWLESTPLPESVRSQLITSMQEAINSIAQAQFATMLDTFAQVVANFLLIGLTFLGLWLVLSILINVVSKFLVTFVHHTPIIGTIDRIGGAVINIALGVIVLAVLYGALEVGVTAVSLGDSSWFQALSSSKIVPFLHDLILPAKI